MENESKKKGISKEAQSFSKKLRDRFVEFVKDKGLSEVSNRTGCNYQALRNSAVDGYNPSLDTIFQVKLGYGDEFDEVYIFTGKRISTESKSTATNGTTSVQFDLLQAQVSVLMEKLNEKELQMQELRNDKLFLQELIKKQYEHEGRPQNHSGD